MNKIPCKFFLKNKCNKKFCKFSHVRVKTNKFNDIIIIGNSQCILETIPEFDINKKKIIIKSEDEYKYDNFTFIFKKNKFYIYANKLVLQKIPIPINGEINGSMIIPIMIDSESQKEYCLLIHRKNQKYGFSFPAGLRDPSDLGFKECAIKKII